MNKIRVNTSLIYAKKWRDERHDVYLRLFHKQEQHDRKIYLQISDERWKKGNYMGVIKQEDRVEGYEGNERRDRGKKVDQFWEIYM